MFLSLRTRALGGHGYDATNTFGMLNARIHKKYFTYVSRDGRRWFHGFIWHLIFLHKGKILLPTRLTTPQLLELRGTEEPVVFPVEAGEHDLGNETPRTVTLLRVFLCRRYVRKTTGT